jgi:hypothetical protein
MDRGRIVDGFFDLGVGVFGALAGSVIAWVCGVHPLLGTALGGVGAFLTWRAFDVDRW